MTTHSYCLLIDENPNDGLMLQRAINETENRIKVEQIGVNSCNPCVLLPEREPSLCIINWTSTVFSAELLSRTIGFRWPNCQLIALILGDGPSARGALISAGVAGRGAVVARSFETLTALVIAHFCSARSSHSDGLSQFMSAGSSSVRSVGIESSRNVQEAIWADLPFGIAVVSLTSTRISYANSTLAAWLGKPRHDLLGSEIAGTHPTDLAKGILHALRISRRGMTPPTFEAAIVSKNGPVRMLDVLVNPHSVSDPRSALVVYLDTTERRSVERKMRRVADAASSATSGKEFFRCVTLGVARVLEVDIASVCRLGQDEPATLCTLATVDKGEVLEDVEMPVVGYPSERVLLHHLICITKGLRKEFPGAGWMIDRQIEGYMGMPVADPQGKVIGLIQIMDRKPLTKTKDLKAVLMIFAMRIAAEMIRLRHEELLERRERLLREAESISGVGSWEWHIRNDRFMISDEGLRLLRLDPPDVEFRLVDALKLVHSEDSALARAALARAMGTDGMFSESVRINRRDGLVRWFEIRGRAQIASDGTIASVAGVFMDTTERRSLARRKAAFARLGQELSAASTKVDAARIILRIAGELMPMEAASFSLCDSEGSRFASILDLDTLDGNLTEFPTSTETYLPTPYQLRVMETGGLIADPSSPEFAFGVGIPFGVVSRKSASIVSVPIWNGSRVLGIVSIHSYRPSAYDSEDLLNLEVLAAHSAGALKRLDALDSSRAAHELLRLVTDSIPAFISYIDSDGRFKLVNRFYESVCALSCSEIENRLIDELPAVGILGPGRQHLDVALRSGTTESFEFEVRDADPSRSSRHFTSTYVPHRDANSKLKGVFSLVTEITPLRRAESNARDIARKLQAIIDNAPAVIFVRDPGGRYQFVNKHWEGITGRSRLDVIGRMPQELLPETAARVILDTDRRVINSRTPVQTECTLDWGGGSRTYILIEFPLVDDAGELSGVCGIATDITAETVIEQALKESEARYRSQYQAIPLPTFTFKSRGGVLVLAEANEAAKRFTEGRVAELIGLADTALYPDQPDLVQEMRECLRQERYVIRELPDYRMRSTGSVRQLRAHVYTLSPDTLVIHIDDLTDRLRTESRYRAMLQLLPDRLFRCDRDGTFLDFHVNDPSQLLVPAEGLIGRNFRDVLPKEASASIANAVERAFQLGEVQTVDYTIQRASKVHHLRGRIVPCSAKEFLAMVHERYGPSALRESH